MSMKVIFLGTASAYPTPDRGVSCIGLKNEDWVWLFDCGEGSQTQVMKSEIKPGKISKIFITHLHGDHCYGLPGLMCTISQNNQRSEPVEIYGPEGLRKFLRTSLSLSQSQLGFDYIVHELKMIPEQYVFETSGAILTWDVNLSCDDVLHPNERPGLLIECDRDKVWELYDDNKIGVKAVWLKHRIPSFAFVIQEKPIAGKLDAAKLKAKGVPPGPLYSKIKAGEKITAPSGEKISPRDVVGPPRPGRKVIICGDTCWSEELLKVGQNADILVHEATLQNSCKDTAIQNGHSTPDMAADIAQRLNVKKLVLTHYSQRYKPINCTDTENQETVQILYDEAASVMGKDRVVAAYDLLSISVPLKSS
ncbi:zinc phosphodiesterase ELAC protein 1-like [Mytilus galloprovincialis]|uniref:Ribonuclease Z n=2 Tax=Mytilus galloprovincialis TaxID=29158 RepID=A0A8B6EKX5_MYTGA|nr:ribonuclease Z [Mytilus galloprovincialis]